MNIFASLKIYATKWSVKETRNFTKDEIDMVSEVSIVASQYGNSMCFMFKSGGQSYIPCSEDCSLGVGDTVDLSKIKLITLEKKGEEDIFRVSDN